MSQKFIFINKTAYAGANSKIAYTTDKTHLPGVLEDFECFLRGAGYSFDGNLEIVNEQHDSGAVTDEPQCAPSSPRRRVRKSKRKRIKGTAEVSNN